MGLTRVSDLEDDVAWLTIPERLKIIWALLTRRATYFKYDVDNTSKWRTYDERPVPLWRRSA